MVDVEDLRTSTGRIDARKLSGAENPPDNPNGGGYVDCELCDELRRARLRLPTDRAVAKRFEMPVNTARDHLRGRCHHEPPTEPVSADYGE